MHRATAGRVNTTGWPRNVARTTEEHTAAATKQHRTTRVHIARATDKSSRCALICWSELIAFLTSSPTVPAWARPPFAGSPSTPPACTCHAAPETTPASRRTLPRSPRRQSRSQTGEGRRLPWSQQPVVVGSTAATVEVYDTGAVTPTKPCRCRCR